jgi:hypothetical protein
MRDIEIACDDCLMQVASYCETELADKEVPSALRMGRDHLEICADVTKSTKPCSQHCSKAVSELMYP